MTTKRANLRRFAGLYGSSIMSLSFNLGGLAAGLIIASSTGVILDVRWALLMYPSVLSVRGAIGGLFSGRLSTALHIGLVNPTFRNNTRHFHLLFDSVSVLTMVSAFVMWMFACGFGFALIGLTSAEMLAMLVVALATMGMSLLVVSPATVLVSNFALRRGLDPDVVTYPIISTVADVLVTVVYLVIVVVHRSSVFFFLLSIFAVLFVLLCFRIWYADRAEEVFNKTIREFAGVLLIIGFFVNIAGSTLERISHLIENQPHIYMIYPAVIDTVGDVGSIVGSTATTKLNLGLMDGSLRSFRNQSAQIGGAWLASLTMFITYAVLAAAFFGTTMVDMAIFLGRIVLTNLSSVGLIVLFSVCITVWTYTRGKDPDNFVIPIESTLSDAITSLCLLASILILL